MARKMWKPEGSFLVTPIVSDQSYRDDPEKKRLFGIELAKGLKPFQAACKIFENTGAALWISQFWLTDPIVAQAQSEQSVKQGPKILDKDQLAVRVLEFADERDSTGRFYINEDKVRLAAFELYAKIQGIIGKTEQINNNTFNNNVMKIELVSPDNQEEKSEIKQIEHNNETVLDLPSVQLVG